MQSLLALAEVARIRGDLLASRRILEDGRAAAGLADAAGGPGADASRLPLQLSRDLWKALDLAGEVRRARERP